MEKLSSDGEATCPGCCSGNVVKLPSESSKTFSSKALQNRGCHGGEQSLRSEKEGLWERLFEKVRVGCKIREGLFQNAACLWPWGLQIHGGRGRRGMRAWGGDSPPGAGRGGGGAEARRGRRPPRSSAARRGAAARPGLRCVCSHPGLSAGVGPVWEKCVCLAHPFPPHTSQRCLPWRRPRA